MISLGKLSFGIGAALAPMAGATDATMRRLCAEHGAVSTVSEMVSAKALTMGDTKSPRLMAGGGGSAPYGIQLFG
ncbi:MAG: tRNA-dihydrouridine synthase, partial [Ruthenibacterium sp.]